MSVTGRFLARPLSYRLWQEPFAKSKFAPVLRHIDLARTQRVLDVGCGPGTNAHYFEGVDYLGIDVNERYVAYARKRYKRDFVVGDATDLTVPAGERFDFVLVNSLLHHLPDGAVRRLLAQLSSVLTAKGHIHVLELELPPQPSVARLLARMDRGDHLRSLKALRELLEESFEAVIFEPYGLRGAGVTLWNMVYFKGRARAPGPDHISDSSSTSTPGAV